MNHQFAYKIISSFYDLLDLTYFRKKKTSPRNAMVDFIPEGKTLILDVCTGTAANGIRIAQNRKAAEVLGIDISKAMLSIADQKIKKRNLSNITTLFKDATATGFENGTFDIAVLSLVLHENSRELDAKILAETRRVLKPEGRLLVIEWEQPRKWSRAIGFFLIRILEPRGFGRFLKMDMAAYFGENGWTVADEKHCDYSRVFSLKKTDRQADGFRS